MAHQKRSFDRKRLDDEIEQLMRVEDSDDLTELPDARLIDDLKHAYQTDRADVLSLSRVYMRLQAHKHHIRANAYSSGGDPVSLSHSSQKGWPSVKSTADRLIPSITHTSGRSLQSRLAAVAGVLLVAVLVISAVWLFNGMRTRNTAAPKPGVAHQGTAHLDIHAAKLQCTTSYGKNYAIVFARPALAWSLTGVLADQHGSLRAFDPQTCTAKSVSWSANLLGRPVWSPDGKRLLLLSGTWTAQVLDATTGQTLATLSLKRLQPAQFSQAAWTSDGTQIVTVTRAYETHSTSTAAIQVWNASTGALIRMVKTASVYASSATVSPNGKYFVLETPGKHLQFWDVSTGQMMSSASSDLPGLGEPAWSLDGASLAIPVGSANWPATPAEVQIYLTATGQHVASFQDSDTFEGLIGALAWSPDGRYLAEGGHAINIWDVKAHKQVTIFGKVNPDTMTTNGIKTSYWVAGLAWSPDGRALASVTGSEPWDPSNPEPDQTDTLNIWQLS